VSRAAGLVVWSGCPSQADSVQVCPTAVGATAAAATTVATIVMTRSLILRIARGDITRWPCDAIVTCANAGLCGNKTPTFWRFRVRHDRVPEGPVGCVPLEESVPFENVDGQVHAAAGPQLKEALDEVVRTRGRQMSHGGGSLLPQSTDGLIVCPAGSAVLTPSFGALREYTSWVVHAVAPDGRYGTAGARSLPILHDVFLSALNQAESAGALSLAIPSVGCGVNSWSAPLAAQTSLDAIEAYGAASTGSGVQQVDFVLRGADELAAWRACANARFGISLSEPDADSWTVAVR